MSAAQSSIPAIALPVISRGDMLFRCLSSLDYPVDNVVVFVNSDDPSISGALSRTNNKNIRNLIIRSRIQYGRGCGPAINEVVKAFPHGPYWMLVGADNFFKPGMLARIDRYCRDNPEVFYFWAHDVVPILTIRGVQEVGLFDENIYPCYFEDTDYVYRVNLAGSSPQGVPDIEIGHGSDAIRGNVTTHTNLDHKFKNEVTYSQNRDYYERKWGGVPGEEKYRTPFNIPGCPISYWNFDPTLRTARLWEEIDGTFSAERRQFIVAYISYVIGELRHREDIYLSSKSEESFNSWRLGVGSLARQVAAVPPDCFQQIWTDHFGPTVRRYLQEPDLKSSNLSDFEKISIRDLGELYGTEFDLPARLGVVILIGDKSPLEGVEVPPWLML